MTRQEAAHACRGEVECNHRDLVEMRRRVHDVPADDVGDDRPRHDELEQVQTYREPQGRERGQGPFAPAHGFERTERQGQKIGHNTCEKPEYTYVMVCRNTGASLLNVSQITPSISCWIPKSLSRSSHRNQVW